MFFHLMSLTTSKIDFLQDTCKKNKYKDEKFRTESSLGSKHKIGEKRNLYKYFKYLSGAYGTPPAPRTRG